MFTFQGLQQLYQTREILMDWESIFCDRLGVAMTTPIWTSMLQQFQFPERRVRRLRVLQSASKELEDWGITELRIWSRGRELSRSAAWRLTASHNRPDVQRAFDNNPVTRWSSAAPVAPGMWIQVDLGADTPIDRVTVETTDRERGEVHLSFENSGEWEPAATGPEEFVVPAASRIRRAQ